MKIPPLVGKLISVHGGPGLPSAVVGGENAPAKWVKVDIKCPICSTQLQTPNPPPEGRLLQEVGAEEKAVLVDPTPKDTVALKCTECHICYWAHKDSPTWTELNMRIQKE